MKIKDMYKKDKTVFSLEVFPPKKSSNIDTVYQTLDGLKDINPSFISVTYGAGGSVVNKSTLQISSIIKNKYNIEAMAHFTCINSEQSQMADFLKEFKDNNITNILALRGDITPDVIPKEDFKYASDMVKFIKKTDSDFGVLGACYPEGHSEALNLKEDILNLKKKVEAGADALITQLFFDNNIFYSFMEKIYLAGINVPVSAGIMPVTNKNQIERMVSMCGASLPQKFVKMMQRYADKPQALIDAGIAYAVDQIVDLISNGVDGIHLYTMNNPVIANKIYNSVKELL